MGNLIFLLLAGSTILLGSCGLIPEESETTTDSTFPSDPTPSPSDPTSSLSVSVEQNVAFRLLTQATFGPDNESLAEVGTKGIEGWIDHQFNIGSAYDSTSDNWPTHLEHTIQIAKQVEPNTKWYHEKDDSAETKDSSTSPGYVIFNKRADFQVIKYQMAAWWDNALGNPGYPDLGKDQLRQRVAYALSQLLVASHREPPLDRRAEALAYYYDLLAKHALGNYRNLLGDVARSPTMVIFLSHQGNRKANKAESIRPDENFAREVMQIFSIGLYELNLDGSPNADNNPSTYPDNGTLVPTYTQEDTEELAKVFTGWDLVGNKTVMGSYNDNDSFGRVGTTQGDYTQAMEFTPYFHEDELDAYYDNDSDNVSDEDGLVTVLGTTFALNTTDSLGNPSGLDAALDVIFQHSNVGPFVSKHLIKNLVTSNPSAQYVADVAQVFNDNGSGVKGDMKSVIKKILTHDEARGSAYQTNADFGKAKEPVLAITQLLRATHVEPLDGWKAYNQSVDDLYWIDDPEKILGYAPMRSLSQFNFFGADFSPNNFNSRVAPELQVQNDLMLAQLNNFVYDIISNSKNHIEADGKSVAQYGGGKTHANNPLLLINFDEEYEILRSAVFPDDASLDFDPSSKNFHNWQGAAQGTDDSVKYQRLLNGFDKLLDKIDEKLLGKTMNSAMRTAFTEYFVTDLRTKGSDRDSILGTIEDVYRFLATSSHYMIQK